MGDPYAKYGGEIEPATADPYAKYGGAIESATGQQDQQPGALSRFIAGAKAGMGGENAFNMPAPDPNRNYLKHPNIANNPLIPGAGVYRDIKAGNYAGAAGRVLGPAAELLPAVLGGRSAKVSPAEGLAEVQAASPQATAYLRQAVPANQTGNARLDINPQYPGAPNPQASPELLQARPLAVGAKPAPPEPSAALASIRQGSASPEPMTGDRVPVGKFAKEVPNPDPYKFSGAPKSMDIVQSTNVGKIGYNPDAKVMTVEYKNGFVYSYDGVPQEIYNAAKESESIGSYISRNVKGRYETVRRGSVLVKKK